MVTIGIEVYPPLEFSQPPLLTIPGYGTGQTDSVSLLMKQPPGGGGGKKKLILARRGA